MTLQKINTRNTVLVLIIIAASAFRLLSFKYKELSNFNPLWSIALFGGAYFTNRWKVYLVPLITMFVSDIAINYLYTSKLVLWTNDSIWIYVCFAIMVFIGSLIKKFSPMNVAFAAGASVAVHWLIMDLPWLYGDMYPHTLAGYAVSLFNAIPFEGNMVLSEGVFGLILFGGFELAKTKYTYLRTEAEVAL